MSYKSFFEQFAALETKGKETTSPFDFANAGTEAVVVMAPAAPVEEAPKTVLQMPHIASTKSVEVVEEPETFKGDLPHLTPEEHEAIIKWVDDQSMEPSVPLEVRSYLTQLALDLKLDAKRRIVPTSKPEGPNA